MEMVTDRALALRREHAIRQMSRAQKEALVAP
jgi:predicted GIY-YIG superfamily endonuclease